MFNPIKVPFDSVMLFNVVKLKQGVTVDDVEMILGEMCNTVKNTYGNDDGGFIAGQVFKYAGFISNEGSVNTAAAATDDHVAIVTYWKSFEQHETSHADATFLEKFSALADLCDETYEIGYNLLWQNSIVE